MGKVDGLPNQEEIRVLLDQSLIMVRKKQPAALDILKAILKLGGNVAVGIVANAAFTALRQHMEI